MNATAAAGCTPRAQRRPAIGTEAHSHPGSAVPARAEPGTASTGERGSSRASSAGDTSAVMAPLTRTPSTRKGRAWTTMATNTVVQVRNATGLSEPLSVPRVERATTTSSTTSRPSTRRRGSRDATSCAALSGPSVDFMAGILGPRGDLPAQTLVHERPARPPSCPAAMPGAPYYPEACSPLPGRCFRMVRTLPKPGRCTAPEPVAWRGSWRAPNGRRYRIEACNGHRPTQIEDRGAVA
jgi:hypothetical protein